MTIWRGSLYRRGGNWRDRWNNVHRSKITYRQRHSGIVVNEKGGFLGMEEPLKHYYGRDEKGKKLKGWHGESIRHSLAAKKGKI